MKKIFMFFILLFIITIFCSCDNIDNMDLKEDITETIVEKILGDNAQVEITYPSPSLINTPQPTPVMNDIEDTNENSGDISNNTEDNEQENDTWPKNIPSKIPRTSLEIVNKMKTPNGIILDFGEVEKIIAIQYTARLKNNGFDIIREEINDKKIDASYVKDEIDVKIYWYKDGAFTLMLTWD